MENIRVYLRIRPFLNNEYNQGEYGSSVELVESDSVIVSSVSKEVFTFDYVGDQSSTQLILLIILLFSLEPV
ncbi:hypothetical protein AYI70_g9735 [Smittium culicis]|uniref:Kinesin motor domain-containing protein n=1 Tax=Smittium culicis TaxID=133412 RepID=A0A1R1X9V9_9FUNG|nr:hypothetical protein AYI70_g9735 [Smittium culicis]